MRTIGQRRQDPAGHPALRGEREHEAPDLRPLPDRPDDRVEDLRRVAARRPLQLGEEGDLLDVAVRHPPGELPDRILREHAEPVVLQDPGELGPGGLVGVVDDDAERAVEAVARSAAPRRAPAGSRGTGRRTRWRTAFTFRRTNDRAISGVVSPKRPRSGAESSRAMTKIANVPASAMPTTWRAVTVIRASSRSRSSSAHQPVA